MEDKESEDKKPIITCRTISCFILILLFCPIIFFIFLIVAKPPIFWDTFVSFNNKDVNITAPRLTLEESRNIVNEQLTNLGLNDVIIPQDVITVLARVSFPELPNLTVEIKDDSMNIYWPIQQKDNDSLLGAAEIKKNSNGELYISRLGTPRITLPKFVVKAVSNAALTVMQFGEEKARDNNLLYKILDANKDLSIQGVEFREGELIITVDINVSFYD